ncbi:MAG: glycosyltransferase family 2 protein [Patescibacteria group bacterium]
MRKLSIVIPCYNEGATISEVIRRVEEAALPGWDREIIVVDDGSTDGCGEILASYRNRIKVMSHEKNSGKGSAVRTGIRGSTGDYVIIQDADLEYDPSEIRGLLDALDRKEGDMIYGSRNLNPLHTSGFLIPRLGVWLITKMINGMYGLKLTDAWTCYKLFPREAGKYFTGDGFEAEILFTAAAARRGLKIAEAPISHYPRSYEEGKKIRISDGLRAVALLAADRARNFGSSQEFPHHDA